jgi:hypothetical protein
MSSPAHSRGFRKATRDVFQAVLAVIAAGGTTALLDMLLGHVNPAIAVPIGVAYKILVTYAMNALETAGRIPVLLPTPGLATAVGDGAAVAVGTVDVVADKVGEAVGEVSGTVESLTGELTGELIGEVVDVDHREEE